MGPISLSGDTEEDLVNFPGSHYADPLFSLPEYERFRNYVPTDLTKQYDTNRNCCYFQGSSQLIYSLIIIILYDDDSGRGQEHYIDLIDNLTNIEVISKL